MAYPNINEYQEHKHSKHCRFERKNQNLLAGSIRICDHGRLQILGHNPLITDCLVWRDIRLTKQPIIWWRARKMLREFIEVNSPPIPVPGQRPAANRIEAAPMTHRPKAPRK